MGVTELYNQRKKCNIIIILKRLSFFFFFFAIEEKCLSRVFRKGFNGNPCMHEDWHIDAERKKNLCSWCYQLTYIQR